MPKERNSAATKKTPDKEGHNVAQPLLDKTPHTSTDEEEIEELKDEEKEVAGNHGRSNLARPPLRDFPPSSRTKPKPNNMSQRKEEDNYINAAKETTERNDILKASPPSNKSRGGSKEASCAQSATQFVSNIILTPYSLVFVTVIVGVFGYIWINHWNSHQLGISDKLQNLELEFEGQHPKSYKIVKAALKKIDISEPLAPAIIILLHSKGDKEIAFKLSHSIADVILPKQIVTIKGTELQNIDPKAAKKNIDDNIKDTLVSHGAGAVFVYDLDLIPAEAATMLHTYCDHENAPFKRVVYVMTVTSNKTISKNSESKQWDVYVNSHLNYVWRAVSKDWIEPLLARLTGSVVAVTAKT